MMPRTILSVLTIACAVASQNDATTLSHLLDTSQGTAVVRVHRAVDPDPATTARQFVREETLAGTVPSTFVLQEPSGHACGRALRGLVPGQRVVVFLREDGGTVALRAGSSRGVPMASADLVGHLRALARTTDPVGRARLCVESLAHSHARVRADAALDLPNLAGLTALPSAARPVLAVQVARALAERDATLPSLVQAAARLGDVAVLDVLLPAYLEGGAPSLNSTVDLGSFLQRGMSEFDHGAVARGIAARLPTAADSTAGQRAVALLAALDTPEALPPLWRLLRATTSRPVAVAAARALLDQGADPGTVARETHPIVFDAANRAVDGPRFRSVLRAPSATGGPR